MAFSSTIKKRPILLSIVCIISYAWIAVAFPSIFSPAVKKISEWLPAVLGIILAANFMSIVGIWHFKQWGVEMYVISFFAKQIVYILIDDISIISICLSAVFIICFLIYYKQMDKNL
ncbi:MAG TPA: hypothetical protein VNG53_02860 [Bacteroidia bacterium]|nr:hypothetical protein [Bacteroidia bacterium]